MTGSDARNARICRAELLTIAHAAYGNYPKRIGFTLSPFYYFARHWPAFAFTYMTAMAYLGALAVYQFAG